MAPPRKPQDQRQDNRDSRLSVVPTSPVQITPPSAPQEWYRETREAWDALWSSDLASVIDANSLPVLKRLFKFRDLQVRLFHEWELEPYVEGSTGQKKLNPAFTEATKLETSIIALEDRLGLSPKAKANLGIAIGQGLLTADDLNRRARELPAVVEVEGYELFERK